VVAQDVLLIDALQGCLIDMMIPDTIGINDHNGAAATYTQAIGQATLDPFRIAQFIETVCTIQLAKTAM
jgi:hypothetical protein